MTLDEARSVRAGDTLTFSEDGGRGFDAYGLGPGSTIRVERVEQCENEVRFWSYYAYRGEATPSLLYTQHTKFDAPTDTHTAALLAAFGG